MPSARSLALSEACRGGLGIHHFGNLAKAGQYIRAEPFIYGVDHALGLPALYACTRLLAESVASLPLKIYNRPSGGGPAVPYTGPSFFDQPSASSNLYDWLYACMTSLVLQGNAWGLITSRDGYGFPQGIEWIPCEFVTVVDDDRQPFNPYRTRVYLYGRPIDNWRTELLHVRAFALPGRTEGISPLRAFALTVMNGLEAERYGTDWFASGGFPPGTFQNTALEVDADSANQVRESLVSALRRHEPLVYGRDWEYKPLAVPPSEAQFIQAMQMNACTTPETRISMADGMRKRAADLSLGDEVVAWDGYRLVTDRVTALAEMPVAPLMRVRVAGGHELTTTCDHPYLAARRPRLSSGEYPAPDLDSAARWIEAADLQLGDYVRLGLDWESTAVPGLDEETAWALGALTGNGGLTTPTATFSTADDGVAGRLSAWAAVQGGKLARVDAAAVTGCQVFNLTGVRDLLREHDLLGRHAHDKHVPGAVFRAGRKVQAAFLAGYLDTDGTVTSLDEAPCAAWPSVSRELLDDCRHLLALCGISAALTRSGEPGEVVIKGRKATRRQGWRLQVQGAARLSALGSLLECAHQGKAQRLGAWAGKIAVPGVKSDYRWARISAVEDAGEGVTIGITVAGTHTHITEGIVTHNTQMAAVYGLPPDRVGGTRGDSLTYNTVEQSTLQVIDALRPWMVRLETAFFPLIPATRYVRFNSDALLKTDLNTRTDIYTKQRNMGMRTIDEIRDLEDLPPLAGDAGGEIIPLEVMVAMSRSIRGIPKSMLAGLELEIDIAADRLEKLQKQGIAGPNTEPAAGSPAQMLGRVIGQQRDIGTDDLLAIITEAAAKVRARQERQKAAPEFIGPWIPSDADLAALAATANGNGNGSHG